MSRTFNVCEAKSGFQAVGPSSLFLGGPRSRPYAGSLRRPRRRPGGDACRNVGPDRPQGKAGRRPNYEK